MAELNDFGPADEQNSIFKRFENVRTYCEIFLGQKKRTKTSSLNCKTPSLKKNYSDLQKAEYFLYLAPQTSYTIKLLLIDKDYKTIEESTVAQNLTFESATFMQDSFLYEVKNERQALYAILEIFNQQGELVCLDQAARDDLETLAQETNQKQE